MDLNVRKFSAGPLEYLTMEQMRKIHSAALEILEDLGTVVHHDEAVQLLKREGAHVRDGSRVFIPTALAERAVKRKKNKRIRMCKHFLMGYSMG